MKNALTTVTLTAVAALGMVSGLAMAQMNPQPPVMPTTPTNSPAPAPAADPHPAMPDPAPATAPSAPVADTMPPCSKTLHKDCVTKSGKVHKGHHKAPAA